jgi:U3 small nucleolar RNA-associated protein 20
VRGPKKRWLDVVVDMRNPPSVDGLVYTYVNEGHSATNQKHKEKNTPTILEIKQHIHLIFKMNTNSIQHIKAFDAEGKSKNRIRFSSVKERSKRASADVYRTYKRRTGNVTSAASREERVHHKDQFHESKSKKRKVISSEKAVISSEKIVLEDSDDDIELETNTTFSMELQLAKDRNSSDLFSKMHYELSSLVGSLPEVLHHSRKIVVILMRYLLSPYEDNFSPSSEECLGTTGPIRLLYVVNTVTTDVLHLLSVLARDLRHEIHPYLHDLIMPRIVNDLINPPTNIIDVKQQLTLDITVIETAFRTMSYIFRYDSMILSDDENKKSEESLEAMRKYYGSTLAHKHELVRRLAAESFAPLVRKMKSSSAMKKHIKRVIRALSTSASSAVSDAENTGINHYNIDNDCLEPSVSIAPASKRASEDAIDGVAMFLFYINRGVPGRLHSKSRALMNPIFSALVSNGGNKDGSQLTFVDIYKKHVIFQVVSRFLSKVRYHTENSIGFLPVWDDILNEFELTAQSHCINDISFSYALGHIAQITTECISHNNGILVEKSTTEISGRLLRILSVILNPEIFPKLGSRNQSHVLRLYCISFKTFSEQSKWIPTLHDFVPMILKGKNDVIDPIVAIARDLIPHLDFDIASKYVIPEILLSASKSDNSERALHILHALATVTKKGIYDEEEIRPEDDLFATANMTDSECVMSLEAKQSLVEFIFSASVKDGDSFSYSMITYVSKVIPFLCSVRCHKVECDFQIIDSILNWIHSLVKSLGVEIIKDHRAVLASAALLHSAATTILQIKDTQKIERRLRKLLGKIRNEIYKLLQQNPGSLLVLSAGALVSRALRRIQLDLHDDRNEVFELLTPNLCSDCHFVRLHTLQMLNTLPQQPFVTDIGDVDLREDLDEEADFIPKDQNHNSKSSLSGICDIIDTMYLLEVTPISLKYERTLIGYINKVEVVAKSGKMPLIYADAAVNHMFGVMRIKFQPLWTASIRAITALISTYEALLWPRVESQLRLVMQASYFYKDVKERIYDSNDDTVNYFEMVSDWDRSEGKVTALFRSDIENEQARGVVSRHTETDRLTIFEEVWAVLESLPEVTSKKSRVIVPIFLQFLHEQYYVYHNEDADAREFDLSRIIREKINPISSQKVYDRDKLGRKILQKKLAAFLKMFSQVSGMQQLFLHKLLLVIFQSLLSDSDHVISQLSLSCVFKFKLSYIVPYKEELKGMLNKAQLRETLTKFDISLSGGRIDCQHRNQLLPVIIRILFGRLSSRGGGTKSIKDSPMARRAAIMSFLACLDSESHEFDYFIYLMIRPFIPKSVNMRITEIGHDDKQHIRDVIQSIVRLDEPLLISNNRLTGFLNLLSDVIKKFGFGVVDIVPIFMKILLMILAHTESLRKSSNHDENHHEEGEENVEEEEEEDSIESKHGDRSNKIRTLCFLRLSEIIEQFVGAFDFQKSGKRLLDMLHIALKNLPVSIANADHVPSLLILLKTMSSHTVLIKILNENDVAIEAIFKCISCRSKTAVMKAALDCIENFLTEGGTFPLNDHIDSLNSKRIGLNIINRHANLLLKQFTERLKCKDQDQMSSRELSILCRISEVLVIKTDDHIFTTQQIIMLQTLCTLLIPYLGFYHKLKEENVINVLGILGSILSQIGAQAALSHLHSFSKLLGPNKSMEGIKSLEVRRAIITCISSISSNECKSSMALSQVAKALSDLNAPDSKHVDEWDFDRLLPVLNNLGKVGFHQGSWSYFAGDGDREDLKILLPLMYSCFSLLYDADGVLSRGALKALTSLVQFLAENSLSNENMKRFAETSLMSVIRLGLKTKKDAIRKSFVLLLARVVKCFNSNPSALLYCDLFPLIRDDDADLDFFLNITHVQLHRRCRALARFRKYLQDNKNDENNISSQTLTNVVLPLVVHPIYECEKKSDEPLAMEAIATVGVISQILPWGKYQSLLNSTLTQFPRYEQQERYLVAKLCSIIDSFHFDISDEAVIVNMDQESSVIWNQLNSKLIPGIERFLVKENSERNGTKVKILRAPIALALVKLLRKLPDHIFRQKFPRLLTEVCCVLQHKESDERDIARVTLAKIMISIPVHYLSDVVREIALQLSEGYKLHVRMATLHTVLNELSKIYVIPTTDMNTYQVDFDRCLPAIMDIIQQDIFGKASEIKEVENVKKRLVKEAGGSKSYSTLEIISRMILFKPSTHSDTHMSSIHTLVNPLLARLDDSQVDVSTIGKVKECLNRITVGISQNSSCKTEEMLPFVYATVAPFVLKTPRISINVDNDSDEQEIRGLEISRTLPRISRKKQSEEDTIEVRKVFEWTPSTLKTATDNKAAYVQKLKEKREMRKVLDGANAPKLTGSSRYDNLRSKGGDIDDPSVLCAVSFALTLLHAHLRKTKVDIKISMADPFVEILSQCVKYSKDTSSILLSLKCLQVLLRLELPSISKFQEDLASCILQILSSLSVNTQSEMVQGCFKTLTLLIVKDKNKAIAFLDNHEDAPGMIRGKKKVEQSLDSILSNEQMQILVSILRSALTDAEHHNATFGVIKAITSVQYVSSEFYDLMETILKMTVQSHKPTMRQQAAKIFMQYLIEYPMGNQRLVNHLKQIVLNIKYEYEDGRLSALDLTNAIIEKLPIPLLEECVQIFFLPLVLQLANDDSKKCKENAAKCITCLLLRLSPQLLNSLYDYVLRWSTDTSSGHLKRTAIQVFGLFLDAKPDYMKKNNRVTDLLTFLRLQMNDEIECKDYTSLSIVDEWNDIYFCLQTVEKIGIVQESALWKDQDLWSLIIKCLVHPHPWVQLISSRILFSNFSKCEIHSFGKLDYNNASNVIVRTSGSLFEIMRNMCYQLNTDDQQQSQDVSTMATKNLCWVARVANRYPRLCIETVEEEKKWGAPMNQDGNEDEDFASSNVPKKPLTWLFTRLSNSTKKRGRKRREAIFKCFAALATVCDSNIISEHLELILVALNRELSEISHLEEGSVRKKRQPDAEITAMAELPNEILQLLENKCGTDIFVKILAKVKSDTKERRDLRKQQMAAEAVHDPESAAKRRLEKQAKEKNRKKRRIGERKASRGVYTQKPRHLD